MFTNGSCQPQKFFFCDAIVRTMRDLRSWVHKTINGQITRTPSMMFVPCLIISMLMPCLYHTVPFTNCVLNIVCIQQTVYSPHCGFTTLCLHHTVSSPHCVFTPLCLHHIVSSPHCILTILYLHHTVCLLHCDFTSPCLHHTVSSPNALKCNQLQKTETHWAAGHCTEVAERHFVPVRFQMSVFKRPNRKTKQFKTRKNNIFSDGSVQHTAID